MLLECPIRKEIIGMEASSHASAWAPPACHDFTFHRCVEEGNCVQVFLISQGLECTVILFCFAE